MKSATGETQIFAIFAPILIFSLLFRTNRRKVRPNLLSEDRLQRVAEFAEQLSPPNSGLRSFVAWHGITQENSTRKRILIAKADKAYEMTDENFEADSVQEKNLSTFRRKRLAEKKYAFTEEESENITPFRKNATNAPTQSNCGENNPDSQQPSTSNVLRPLSANTELSDLFEVPELLSPGGMMVKRDNSLQSPRSDQPRFHAKFTRKFVELDEEAISVMTEIEDDDSGATGYHSALPLEVIKTGAYFQLTTTMNKSTRKSKKVEEKQESQETQECAIKCKALQTKVPRTISTFRIVGYFTKS